MDTVIYGKIYTMDREKPYAEALGIEDGKIVYVGSRKGLDSNTVKAADRVVECGDKAVFPGFIDTHVHAVPSGPFMKGVDVSDVKDIEDLLARMREYASSVEKGKWVFATKFQDKNIAEKRFPTREELDSVSTEHPVMLYHNDTHPFAFNRMGIEIMNLDPAIDGIETDADGKPTGFVTDPAFMEVADNLIDLFSDEELLEGYHSIDDYAVSNGITTVYTKDYYKTLRLFRDHSDEFKTETKPMLRTKSCDDAENVTRLMEDKELRDITCVCAFADGAFDGYTGSVVEPYEGYPDRFGMLFQSADELYRFFEGPHRAGMQLSCHAIGDNGIIIALEVYERLLSAYPRKDHRHRIEHFEMPKKASIAKAASLGVALGMQPLLIEVCEGMDMEGYRCFIGDRVERCSPYRSILDAGILVGGGSDYSVTAMDPLRSAMICLQHPVESERISLYEALEMFTVNAAKLGFMENRKGMLKQGMDADIVILETNPFEVPVPELCDIKVAETIAKGKTVHLK